MRWLEQRLLVLGVVVLGVLADVPELACLADAVGDLATLVHLEIFDLVLELLVAVRGEDDVFVHSSHRPCVCAKRHGNGAGRETTICSTFPS